MIVNAAREVTFDNAQTQFAEHLWAISDPLLSSSVGLAITDHFAKPTSGSVERPPPLSHIGTTALSISQASRLMGFVAFRDNRGPHIEYNISYNTGYNVDGIPFLVPLAHISFHLALLFKMANSDLPLG